MPTLKTINGVEPLPKPVKLADDAIFVGRAKICKIVLMDKLASRKHLKIFKIDQSYYAEDLKSRNGSFLNGQKLEGIKKLQSGDVLKVGEHEIVFDTTSAKAPTISKANAPTALKPNPDEIIARSDEVTFGAPGTVYCLNFSGDAGTFSKVLLKPITTVGRGDEADIHINEMLASRLHCQFEIKAGGLKLVDLESRNGTKVQGEFVNQQYLDKNDEVVIGGTKIVVNSRLPLTSGEYQEMKIEEALEKNMDIDQLLPTGDKDVTEQKPETKPSPGEVNPILRYKLDDEVDKTFTLHKTEVTIGRSDEATLTISDKLSSRIHAKITCDDDRYFVEDLNSRNGTKINKREVKGKIELLPGDVIQVGEIEFEFIIPSDVDPNQGESITSFAMDAQKEVPQLTSKKQRRKGDRRVRKPVSEPADNTGVIIAVVVLAVVVILAILLIMNNSGSGTSNFPEEPDGNSTTGDTGTISSSSYTGNNTGSHPFKSDDDDDNDDGKTEDKTNNNNNNADNANDSKNDDDDELDEKEIEDNWVEEAPTKFVRDAREEFVNIKRKVYGDLLLSEHYGIAYVHVTGLITKYQNKGVDDIIAKANEVIAKIDKEANSLWETYIKEEIKKTPEAERSAKFKQDIIDWFEGYDKYFEPAMQMIGE